MVRLLESGQELNHNFKVYIVAVASFTIGVVATNYYNQSSLADRKLTPRQKELQVIAIEAEKRPFFPVAAPLGNASPEEQ